MEQALSIQIPESLPGSAAATPFSPHATGSIFTFKLERKLGIHHRQGSTPLPRAKLTNTSLEKRINLEDKLSELLRRKKSPSVESLEFRKELVSIFGENSKEFFESCYDSELRELWRLSLGMTCDQMKSSWTEAFKSCGLESFAFNKVLIFHT
jgi:hypothetical protein